jgi:dihydrofolate reductase
MRNLVVLTFLSLDGVMQAPGGKGEDPSGGFDLEGWSVPFFDEALGAEMTKQMSQPFDLLLGRKTCESLPPTGLTRQVMIPSTWPGNM